MNLKQIKYLFYPSRWRSFYIHLLRKHLNWIDQSEWTPEVHEVEQYMYRFIQCNDCIQEGHCIHSDCKCKMPERAQVRSDECPTKKWPPFKDKEGWEDFKDRRGTQFYLVENKT